MASRRPWPFPTSEHHPPADPAMPLPEEPTEDALDHGIEESFPASDPVAVTVTTVPAEDEAHRPEADGQQGGEPPPPREPHEPHEPRRDT